MVIDLVNEKGHTLASFYSFSFVKRDDAFINPSVK